MFASNIRKRVPLRSLSVLHTKKLREMGLILIAGLLVGGFVGVASTFVTSPRMLVIIFAGAFLLPFIGGKIAWSPEWGIGLALAFAPFYEVTLGLVRTRTNFPERILTGWPDAIVWAIVIGSLIRLKFTRKQKTPLSQQPIFLILLFFFVVWSMVAVIVSPSFLQGYLGFHWSYLWPMVAVILWLNPLPIRTVRWLIGILMAALLISVCIGLFQQVVLGQAWTSQFYASLGYGLSGVPGLTGGSGLTGVTGGILRMPSTMVGPWRSGPAYFILTMLGLSFALYDSTSTIRWRYFCYMTVVLGIIGVLFTISRASWVALPIGGFIILLPLISRNIFKAFFIGLAILSLLIAMVLTNRGFQYALDTIVNLGGPGDTMRFERAVDNATFIVNNYPFGVGAGTSGVFLEGQETATSFNTTLIESRKGENDNFYVKILWELGIPGVILLLSISFGAMVLFFRRVRWGANAWIRSLALACVAIFIGAHMMMITSNLLDWNPIKIYFWLFIGFIPSLQVSNE